MRPRISVARVGASFDATTTSSPSAPAARRKAVARYVSVGRTSMTLVDMEISLRWHSRRRTMGISVKAPKISATDYALTRIEQVRANRKQPDAGVRIAITGRRDGQFSYDLALVKAGEEREGELSVEGPAGVRFTMPLESAPYLDGITVDADRLSGALRVDNPNPLWLDELARDVQRLLDDEINPSVASHGGYIDLLDVSDGVAFIHMGGGCQGCGMAEVTLGQGVRVAILSASPRSPRFATPPTTPRAQTRTTRLRKSSSRRRPTGRRSCRASSPPTFRVSRRGGRRQLEHEHCLERSARSFALHHVAAALRARIDERRTDAAAAPLRERRTDRS